MMSFDGRQGSSAARPLTEPTTKTEAEKNKLDQSTRTAPANAAGREFTELKTPTSDKIQQMRAEELE
ncbi:MAG: hypothetical protein KDD62_06075, partial [Bdellovibrionales bacterium]|nr:hypothetical protein [Bdellovibrionales bacterium]